MVFIRSLGAEPGYGACQRRALGAPAWQAMMSKVIHPDRKGMLFGMGLAFGST